jgi:phage tail sheath protein FI
MAFQLSPGVNVSEQDLTTVVPSVASSTGAFAGVFAWGPVNEVVTISNEVRLVETFGKPNNDNYEYWFSAANFLAYSNTLRVVRTANTVSTLNATANGNGVLIENESDYESNHNSGANTFGSFAAKYPGDLGNSIRVEVADANTFIGWAFASSFTDAPSTSNFVAQKGGTNDELHIVVVDTQGKFTGSANSVLERYSFVSKASDAKTFDGTNNYYRDVLNTRSLYTWWLSHPAEGTNWGTDSTNKSFDQLSTRINTQFAGGSDGVITSGNVINAYAQVSNPDSVEVSLIISGPANQAVAASLISIVEDRKDCVVFLSPEKVDVVDNYGSETTDILTYRNSLNASSYAVMDSGWKYQYDKFNDVFRWVPLNADIAGVCARTDLETDPWFSPAGTNRGAIRNVIKLAWNPTKADRDDLYTKGVNPVVTFQGEGTILFGDKTMQSRPSAFDRINVRRLFIVLEKSIARAARTSLFEFNDQFTRAQFVALVEPFLRDVQGRRGITDFRVVCDETNNTTEIVDRNEFVGDIYIKPARSINFIQLNFVAVRSGVSFDEIVGRTV